VSLGRLDAGIVGSNSVQGIYVCLNLCCAVLCLASGVSDKI
jgi:hypothetical protein